MALGIGLDNLRQRQEPAEQIAGGEQIWQKINPKLSTGCTFDPVGFGGHR
jgi:hypothetical protein